MNIKPAVAVTIILALIALAAWGIWCLTRQQTISFPLMPKP